MLRAIATSPNLRTVAWGLALWACYDSTGGLRPADAGTHDAAGSGDASLPSPWQPPPTADPVCGIDWATVEMDEGEA